MVAVEPGSDAARLGVCRGWMLHAVNGDVVCPAFAVPRHAARKLPTSSTRWRAVQQVSQRGPVQVSSRTASAVLAVQCQQTVADEHEGQHNAVQLVFDVWHKPAQTFKDQVHRRWPHLCSMKAPRRLFGLCLFGAATFVE